MAGDVERRSGRRGSHPKGNGEQGHVPTKTSLATFALLPETTGVSPRVGRLVLVGAKLESEADGERALLAVVSELDRGGHDLDYLVTPAGFVVAKVSQGWERPKSWKTTSASWDVAARVAADVLDRVATQRVLAAAGGRIRRLCLGIDVKFADGDTTQAAVQTAWVIDTATGSVVGSTGKSYPYADEENVLIRSLDAATHVLKDDRTAVLVCHDLTVFNPRSRANRKGQRAAAGSDLEQTISDIGPPLVLHLAHAGRSPVTWNAAWNSLRPNGKRPGDASSFRYRPWPEEPKNRKSALKLLQATAHPGVATIIVGPSDHVAQFRNWLNHETG